MGIHRKYQLDSVNASEIACRTPWVGHPPSGTPSDHPKAYRPMHPRGKTALRAEIVLLDE